MAEAPPPDDTTPPVPATPAADTTPSTPPQAAADKPPSAAPAEPLKGEVSRTDAAAAAAPAPPAATAPKPATPAAKAAASAAGAATAPKAAHPPPAPAPPSGPPDPPPPADKIAPAFIASLQATMPGSVTQVSYWVGDWTIIVPVDKLLDVARHLRDAPDALFDFCSDVTATDWPPRGEGRFDVVYNLYSIRHRQRIRVKVKASELQAVPSVTGIWPAKRRTSNERSTFDVRRSSFSEHRTSNDEPARRTASDERRTIRSHGRTSPSPRRHVRHERARDQHGPAASEHARRAAGRAASRRREGRRRRRRHRISAPRHREVERKPQLDADHPADRPDGLRRGGDQQRRVLRDGREADVDRGAAPRAVRADDSVRAAAYCEPLPVDRHARDGHRCNDRVSVRVPRARADPRSVRGVLRRAPHLQLDADWRTAAGHSARLGAKGSRVLHDHELEDR